MAEAIGLAASIIAIAETGVKVASTLWKLGVNLKNAGKEAKEISKKIKLVSKALKQVETKLNDGSSIIDHSLVEDYIMLCEERMENATQLIEVLESEMGSGNPWSRTVLKIRFILEKSTFTLLQQDMDSLQMTLSLYITTLTYQQAGSNREVLTEIRDQLTELKQEVENDLQDRSVSNTLNAAVLTLQYNQFFPNNSSSDKRDTSLQQPSTSSAVVEELDPDATDGKDEQELPDSQKMQSLSLSSQRGEVGSFLDSQSIPLDMIEDETVSKALVLFTQIQIVQKKTLRRVDYELRKEHKTFTPTTEASDALPFRSNAAPHQSSVSDDTTGTFEAQTGSPSVPNSTSHDVANNEHVQEHMLSPNRTESRQSLSALLPRSSSRTSTRPDDGYHSISSSALQQLIPVAEREELARRYTGQSFKIENCKTGVLSTINFSLIKGMDLPEIILDMHMQSLKYNPPSRRYKTGEVNNQSDTYHPPPYADIPNSKFTALWKSGSAHEAFVNYVVDYAQWYLDSHRLAALQNGHYDFTIRNSERKKLHKNAVSQGSWISYIAPGAVLTINFLTRQLTAENMIKFGRNFRYSQPYIDEGPYIQDLWKLQDTGEYYLGKWIT